MKRLFIVVISMFLFKQFVQGQTAQDFVSLQNFTPPSPESAAMDRYGDIPVDLSSGLLQVGVPIYEIKSKKLSLPISLSYHASGIKVQDLSTPVGLGWVLNAGGSVSRNVVGKADENGMLTGTPGSYFKSVSSLVNSVYPTHSMDFAYLSNIVGGGVDIQSDIYHFNMPGLNGKFVYDHNFDIQYQPVDKQLKINRTPGNKFNIIDDAGNIYRFTETETTSGYSSTDITTWHLTSMVSVDQTDSITFEYIAGATIQDPETSYTYNISVPFSSSPQVSLCELGSPNFGLSESTVPYSYDRKLLSRINFSGGYVTFEYINDREDPAPERLDVIKIFRTDNTLIKKVKLDQSYFTSDNAPSSGSEVKYYKRMRLDTVKFKSSDDIIVNRFNFEYNAGGGMPPYRIGGLNGRKSLSIDYWGYNNGAGPNGNVASLIPSGLDNAITQFIVSAYGNANYSSSVLSSYYNVEIDRDVSTRAPDCALKKITYPTGGNTEFLYEQNRLANTGPYYNYAGGFRIKTATSFDPVAQASKVKTYAYSDGQLITRIAPFAFYYQTTNYSLVTAPPNFSPSFGWCSSPVFTIVANPTSPINYYSGSPVIYDTITEYEGTDLANIGKTVYHFDTESDSIVASPYWTKYTYIGADKSWARGGLLNQKIYKNTGGSYSLIKETRNTYASLGQRQVKVGQICELVQGGTTNNISNYWNYWIGIQPATTYALLNYFDYADVILPFGIKKLIKTEDIDYLNDTVINTKEFFYQSPNHMYTSRIKSYTSIGGDSSIAEMRYPQDKASISGLSGTASAALDSMVAFNIKTTVVESKTYKNTIQLFRNLTEFRYWSGKGRIYPEFLSQQIGSNSLEQRIQFISYDSRGNLTSQKKSNDVVNSYVWGYNKLYPVASIIGKTYSDAISQSGVDTTVINNPSNDAALRTELDKFRTLTGAFASTFTYKPLSGVSSQTDTRGLTTYYEYDKFNRLALVRDNYLRILKRICYNFAGEQEDCSIGTPPPITYYNDTVSQVFTRNNCAACHTGSQVTYMVAANTYSSIVSPQAAQQLALDDIAANGQTYANANGTCTQTAVSITYDNQTNQSGYTATYTNNSTSQVYAFSIPASSTGNLGCVPSGIYTVNISKSGGNMVMQFGTGCHTTTGTSYTFGRVSVDGCHHVSMTNFID